MAYDALWVAASEHSNLYLHQWLPATPVKAVVLLAHGMAEHGGRYQRLGQALSAAGFALLAPDQRGHGRTAENGRLGLFARKDGWNAVVNDLGLLSQHIGERFPGTPLFLFGHSMGSYIVQAYLLHHSASVHGAILSGSNLQPPRLYRAAALIARAEAWRQGAEASSALIDKLSFGSFNNAFKPTRTPFDWLSRDEAEVDKYISDPLCGFRCSNQLWLDLLRGLAQVSRPSNLAQVDPNLPILIIGGECDPVSAGKRLSDLAVALSATGNRHVQLRLYPQARHELLNETNRDEVTADILGWLEQTLALGRPARSE